MINSRIALSIASIGAAGALIAGATFAFFSDTETSAGNTFAAGEIDLTIDNESFYNGALSTGTTWLTPANLDDVSGPGPNGAYLFFNFGDVKPADFGEDTISLHVTDNDSWVCADVKLTSDNDNTTTEPEGDLADDLTVGELADAIDFLWWADDGDNILEVGETTLPSGPIGNLSVGQTATVDLADNNNNIWAPGPSPSPFPGGATRFIGKAWCFGTIGAQALAQDGVNTDSPASDNNGDTVVNSLDGGFTCDGSGEGNITQSDSFTADIAFRAIQSRNNATFECTVPNPQ